MPNCRQGQMQEQPGTPVADVPDYIPPRESPLGAKEAGRHRLALLTPKSHAFLNSSFANMAVQRHAAGEQCAMMHPDDASARGIRNDAMVTVFNDRGRLTCKAKLTTDIIQGAVAVYSGYWRGDSREKAAVNVLAGAAMANIGRAPTFSDVAVDVVPV
jgi:anaerobic selenocysteine-containing dehydrogenase